MARKRGRGLLNKTAEPTPIVMSLVLRTAKDLALAQDARQSPLVVIENWPDV